MNNYALEILIATSNAGKVREIRGALADFPFKLRQLDEFPNLRPIDEIGHTYEENAALKALGYAQQTGISALADDSGLEVDALDGKPGVLSARLGGGHLSDGERTQKLLSQLARVNEPKRTARFVCSMVFAGWCSGEDNTSAAPRLIKTTQGVCNGEVINEPRGRNGFGFDPVFVPEGYSQTFAELPHDIKRKISHRGKALDAMCMFLEDWVRQT